MKAQLVHGVEVQRGSDNVFADLGLADAEKLKIKTGLVIEIRKAMRSRELTQQEAAKQEFHKSRAAETELLAQFYN